MEQQQADLIRYSLQIIKARNCKCHHYPDPSRFIDSHTLSRESTLFYFKGCKSCQVAILKPTGTGMNMKGSDGGRTTIRMYPQLSIVWYTVSSIYQKMTDLLLV